MVSPGRGREHPHDLVGEHGLVPARGPTRLDWQGAWHGATPPLDAAWRTARRAGSGSHASRYSPTPTSLTLPSPMPACSRSSALQRDAALAVEVVVQRAADQEAAHVAGRRRRTGSSSRRSAPPAPAHSSDGTTIRHSSIHQPTVAPAAKGSRRRAGIANRKRLSRLHSYVPLSSRRCISPRYPTSPHMTTHSSPHR